MSKESEKLISELESIRSALNSADVINRTIDFLKESNFEDIFTGPEKKLLWVMFKSISNMLDITDQKVLEIDGEYFDHNDLYAFSQKLGIDYYGGM